MSKTLVIAEKPAAGRDIAAALGAAKKIDGALEGNDFVVTWAAGHLVTLKEPEEYKEEWKKWGFETLPIIPEKYELKVTENGKKQFGIIKKFLISKEFSKVVNACDAGREGELIFDYIYRLTGSKIPAYRLWTSAALTSDAILREFEKLRPIEEFNGLRIAARARAVADWSIGMNATRAVTLAAQSAEQSKSMTQTQVKSDSKSNSNKSQSTKNTKTFKPSVFSVGRVQTPTLQFIVQREKEILGFKSKLFWTIKSEIITQKKEKFFGMFEHKKNEVFTNQIESKEAADKIILECKGKTAKIVKVESKDGSTSPPLLFDLTELQKECNKRFAFSATKTLELTQVLYEKHKCISYPRTEYRHLTEDNREQIPKILNALEENFHQKWINEVSKNFKKENKRIFDNSKVGDHHALIPTFNKPKDLNELEENVYKLIVNRFLAVFAPNFEFTKSIIAVICEGNLFVSRGIVIKKQGWKNIENDVAEDENGEIQEQDSEKKDQKLPNLNVGDFVKIENLILKEDKTKPPLRYNDASILTAMQNPSAKTENEEEKEFLRNCGLGTPATRASIIKNIEEKGYIFRENKILKPTEKAFKLINFLEKSNQKFLSNPIMTADWEKNLQEIEKNPKAAFQFLNSLNTLVKSIVENVKTLDLDF